MGYCLIIRALDKMLMYALKQLIYNIYGLE